MDVPDYCTPTDRGPCEDCGESGVVWEDGFVLCDDCARLRCAKHKLEQERARLIDGTSDGR